jgi:hypothetical protein
MMARYRRSKPWAITRLLKACHRNWTQYYLPDLRPLKRRGPAARG